MTIKNRSFKSSEFFQCGRKWQFISHTEANSRAKEIYQRDGVQMRAYQCPFCHGFHLTKKKAV